MINKETITFNEFRAWLTGLIVGKKGTLPDLDDWKQIKAMLDKVVPDTNTITYPPLQPAPNYDMPQWPTYPSQPTWAPNTGDPYYPGGGVWCDGMSLTVGGCYGESKGTYADTSVSYTMNHQLELNLEDTGAQATTGLVQVNIEEESKRLGVELQRMIEEVEDGQKESS